MGMNFYATQEWIDVREQVLERDNNTCRYCGYIAYSADHVTPRSKGGADTADNLVGVCRACNYFFLGRYFPNFEKKKAFYKKWVLDPWNEYMERLAACEKRIGKPLSDKQKRQCRIKMIAEKKWPFHPQSLEHDHRCHTCAAVAPLQEACEKGWPNEDMCDLCATEQGVELNVREYVEPTRLDKWDIWQKKDSTAESRFNLSFRRQEELETRHLTPEQKQRWYLDHADVFDAMNDVRKICRSCGVRTFDYELVDGLPRCRKDCSVRNPYAPTNYQRKGKAWQVVTDDMRERARRTEPADHIYSQKIVRDKFTRREINEWNLKHAEWLELTMVTRRVMRCCGRKRNEWQEIDGLPYCVECKGKDWVYGHGK